VYSLGDGLLTELNFALSVIFSVDAGLVHTNSSYHQEDTNEKGLPVHSRDVLCNQNLGLVGTFSYC
jgi:hypothetical protein